MKKPFVDLHVHSYYSDGSMSPEEIVESAVKNNVGLLAVADHDVLEGSLKTCELCKEHDIRCIPAAEIDAIDGSTNYHILAYGFDIQNREFGEFLGHTRFLLDESGAKLIELMQSDYDDISFSDYMDFIHDRSLGGWRALQYFVQKGLTSSLKEGIKFYPQYGITYDKLGYSSVCAVAYRIKKAGGYSVLAHPGETINTSDIGLFHSELSRIMAYGLDGIECYYPSHSGAVQKTCIDYCNKHHLLITAGSDCHGRFGRTQVGEMKTPLSKLVLGRLIDSTI